MVTGNIGEAAKVTWVRGMNLPNWFRSLVFLVTATLLLSICCILAPTPSHGQDASANEQQSRPARKSVRRWQAARKVRKAGKQSGKRDQDATGEPAESGETQGAVTRNATSAESGASAQVKDEAEAFGGSDKRGDVSSANTGKRRLGNVGPLEGGAKGIEQANASAGVQYSRRMEFDARLVYGETAGSGAVILFERGQRNLPPLTDQRKRFLAATIEPVFGTKYEPNFHQQDTSKSTGLDKTDNRSTIDGSRN